MVFVIIFIFLNSFVFSNECYEHLINKEIINNKSNLKSFRFDLREKINFFNKFLNKNDLVFDVGANIGLTADIYLFCNCKVVCFEPQPNCIEILNKKFSNNKNVFIEKMALGFEEAKQNLLICPEADVISTFSKTWIEKGRFSHFKWSIQTEVEVTTLERMIKKYGKPKFVKIDVEGYENEVLKGLNEPVNYLSFEATYEFFDDIEKNINHLAQLGYKEFNFTISEKPIFVFNNWLDKDEFLKALKWMFNYFQWNLIWGDVYAKI